MTPAARLQAAIEILDGLEKTSQPADRFLRDWFRARRYAGAKDRAAVAERVYDVLRHRESFAWRMGGPARSLVIASLLAEGQSPDAIEARFAEAAMDRHPSQTMNAARWRWHPKRRRGTAVSIRSGSSPSSRALGDHCWRKRALSARAAGSSRQPPLRANVPTCWGLGSLGIKAEPMSYSPNGMQLPRAKA